MLTNATLLVAAGTGVERPAPVCGLSVIATGWEGPGRIRGGVGLTSCRFGLGGLGGVYCLSGGCSETAICLKG